MGDLPAELVVSVWDGTGPPPPDGDKVRVVVPTYVPPAPVAKILAGLPRLELVQALTAGTDYLEQYVPEGVALATATGVHSAAVSDWILTMILASLSGLPRKLEQQHASGMMARKSRDTLDGKRLLMVGYGAIGRALEHRLAGFDVEITRIARRPRSTVETVDALEVLLPETDILVLLVPIDATTENLISRQRLAQMPDGALVVNAARGEVLDQDALYDELVAGRLYAALDVAKPDPLPAEHPLRHAPNLIYTPHIAGMTQITLSRTYELIRDQLIRLTKGQTPINLHRSGGHPTEVLVPGCSTQNPRQLSSNRERR